MGEPRSPARIPDDDALGRQAVLGAIDVSSGADTDGDGRPDTTIGTDGIDLVLHTDLDGDSIADQVLRIGPDGVVREAPPAPGFGGPSDDGWSGVDATFEL